jgi:outer membrane protein insertion porin family
VGGAAPYLELSRIGDSWTARGFKADRFLDRAMCLSSIEYRFGLHRKLGGVAFADAGRVWPALRGISLRGWHGDAGGGLRYYLETFVTRLDVGSGPEGTRVFLQFGQVF